MGLRVCCNSTASDVLPLPRSADKPCRFWLNATVSALSLARKSALVAND